MLAHHRRGRRCTRTGLDQPRRFAPATSPVAIFAMARVLLRVAIDRAIVILSLLSNEQLDPPSPAATLLVTSCRPVGVCVSHVLSLTLHGGSDTRPTQIAIDQAVVAGWTGRDAAAVEKHIKELEALGREAAGDYADLLSRLGGAAHHRRRHRGGGRRIGRRGRVRAAATSRVASGSAPAPTIPIGRWRNTGSPSPSRCATSRSLPRFWAFDEVAPHWDRLMLRAHVVEAGKRVLYQEGPVTAMLDPRTLIARLCRGRRPAATAR